MKEISLCMIVKNEELVLKNCLESIYKLVDEIIIVDTGSTDATKEIAKNYTNKIYDFEWSNDFSAARNFSFSKATKDYILWLDADDILTLQNQNKFLALKQSLDGSVDLFYFKYEIAFDEMNNPTFSYNRERLLKNDGSFFWSGTVHEAITPHGKTQICDVAIRHNKINFKNPKRNLKIYQSQLKQGHKFNAREQYYYAREFFYNGYYKKCITELNRFLKMPDAWIENVIDALTMKANCHIILKENDKALNCLFSCLNLNTTQAKTMCMIGDILQQQSNFKSAIFWYSNALNQSIDNTLGSFIEEEYYNIYPSLQLCVCYYNLGDVKTSKFYNDLALKTKPYHKIALQNDNFFKSINNL